MNEKDNILGPQEEIMEVEESGAVEEIGSVSAGDAVLFDMAVMNDIAYGVQTIADSSTQGYLNNSIVQVFDRLVDASDYRYYCAYKPSNGDSNTGILYLSNQIENGELLNCQVIKMYREQIENSEEYNYCYDVSYDDAERFDFGNGTMFYTNVVDGYPALGSVKEASMLSWFPVLAVMTFLSAMMIRRKIKEC